MKGGKYTKTLAKIQVIRTFRMRDIRRNDTVLESLNQLNKSHTGGDNMRNASGHQCRANQRQRNVQKKCAARAKLLFC